MAYKKRITKSVVLDSASPNSALDVMIDWIVNKFITDVPDLKIQKEIKYSYQARVSHSGLRFYSHQEAIGWSVFSRLALGHEL